MNETESLYKLAQIIGQHIMKLESDRDYYKAMYVLCENKLKEANNDREGIQGAPSGEQIDPMGAETVTGAL